MKRMKKLASLFLAIVMILSMTVVAFAEGETPSKPYSITVKTQSDRVSLAGNTYNAYKLFNVTYDGESAYAYTVADEFESYSYEGNSGKELVEYVQKLNGNADELNKFAEDVFKFISEENISVAGSVAVSESTDRVSEAEIGLDEMGYYLVSGVVTKNGAATEDIIAACSLDTVTGTNKDITIKADAPTLEKKIMEEDKLVDANNASVGDTVTYQIKSIVPNMTGYEKYYFIVHDQFSEGLTFEAEAPDNNAEPVKLGNPIVEIGGTKLEYGKDYTVSDVTKDNSIKIVFNDFIQHANKAGQEIIITYTATINQDAVIGNLGNVNTAYLQYSNNPNTELKGDNEPGEGEDDVTGETPKDKVVTYITQIDLTKVIADTEVTLPGAEFTIQGQAANQVKISGVHYEADANGEYYKLTDGSYTTTEPVDNTDYRYAKENGSYIKANKVEEERWETIGSTEVSQNGIVGEDGKLSFAGLAAGEYFITEVKAPEGYNKLENPIRLVITCEEPASITDGNEKAAWKYSVDDGQQIDATNDGHIEYTVENKAGALLPSTGGIGTTIFYAAGIILMAGAVFFVVRRKRA